MGHSAPFGAIRHGFEDDATVNGGFHLTSNRIGGVCNNMQGEMHVDCGDHGCDLITPASGVRGKLDEQGHLGENVSVARASGNEMQRRQRLPIQSG